MAGNELDVCKFLLSNIGILNLKHIGKLWEIGAPSNNTQGFVIVQTLNDLSKILTSDSRKKADVYLNRIGVSIKQSGGSVAYNRLQRASILNVYSMLGFERPDIKITQIDEEVYKFHQGLLTSRNRPWAYFFSEADFKKLLNFFMLIGSANYGISPHPARFILEAPALNLSQENLNIYSFDEYFDRYKEKFSIAIRRQWIGQLSQSEHSRALSMASKIENLPWVFTDIVGKPRGDMNWREDFPISQRRTVYFLMIEKAK